MKNCSQKLVCKNRDTKKKTTKKQKKENKTRSKT